MNSFEQNTRNEKSRTGKIAVQENITEKNSTASHAKQNTKQVVVLKERSKIRNQNDQPPYHCLPLAQVTSQRPQRCFPCGLEEV